MKFFATTVALAAAVAAEADPQFLVNTAPVVSSPLLKTIIPAAHYAKPVAVTYGQVPFQTQYVATKPVQVETTVEKVVEPEQKVTTYTTKPVAYAQPIAYQPAVYAQHQQVYAQPQVAYAAQPQVAYAAQPAVAYAQPAYTTYAHGPVTYAAKQVYHAKNGAVEHKVISKREAEAEPIDYVNYKTGALSSISYPTLGKTLSAYNKFAPATYAAPAVAYNGYVAPAVAHATYAAPAVAYNGYAAPQVYAGQYAHQYAVPQYANQYHF